MHDTTTANMEEMHRIWGHTVEFHGFGTEKLNIELHAGCVQPITKTGTVDAYPFVFGTFAIACPTTMQINLEPT